MVANPTIKPLPMPGQGQVLAMPAPPAGIGQIGGTTSPYQQAGQFYRDAARDFRDQRADFRALPVGPERQAARPQFDMQRDYFQDTRDWHRRLNPQAQQFAPPPSMPLQISPTYQGFPGPYPGTQAPLPPNLNPQERVMARLNSLSLPPEVLKRLIATLSSTGQTAPTGRAPTTPAPTTPATEKPTTGARTQTPRNLNDIGDRGH